MKLTTNSSVPVYTISGSSTLRALPEWLVRKRKRSLKNDPEYANRVELLQDFEFEEASNCIRVSDDGNWVMSTGTYKPQIHVHSLSQLSLSFARHTPALNLKFLLLSSDYSKSIHLQTDRSLEFHTPQGLHHTARIPRYGRDLQYDKRRAEALIPAVGVNGDSNGEVFRLNLETGRFMRAFEVDVGGDDLGSAGAGALQGGIGVGGVNACAIADESHGLLAFGTSLGTVEFWDGRSRSRVGILGPPSASGLPFDEEGNVIPSGNGRDITALSFHASGLTLASGNASGLIHLYDIRSATPLLKKDQGYNYPIQTLTFLQQSITSSSSRAASNSELSTSTPKVLSSDKRIIKIWDQETGAPWTSVEPAVDINDVAWCRDSGMILTANEGREMHSFLIPALGPAPKWCSFLDNLVEEMAEDSLGDPSAYTTSNGPASGQVGATYDNYKFLTRAQLGALNLSHLIGSTNLLRPYMHGFFVHQRLYEEARLIADPFVWEDERQKRVKERIEKERESRIRSSGSVKKMEKIKVNKRLAEKLLKQEERREIGRAKAVLRDGGDEMDVDDEEEKEDRTEVMEGKDAADEGGLLQDSRFASLFRDEDFAVDEERGFQQLNPSTVPTSDLPEEGKRKGLTATEEEEIEIEARRVRGNVSSSEESSGGDSEEDDEDRAARASSRKQSVARKQTQKPKATEPSMRISSSSYKASGHQSQRPKPAVQERSFGSRLSSSKFGSGRQDRPSKFGNRRGLSGDKEVTFMVGQKKREQGDSGGKSNGRGGEKRRRDEGRRSASGNVFRRM